MVTIDYEDPHNSEPEPNHLFPMLFQSLISDFYDGGSSPSNEYSASDAKAQFNADWVVATIMDVINNFSDEFIYMARLEGLLRASCPSPFGSSAKVADV